jgi:hypothetical protein
MTRVSFRAVLLLVLVGCVFGVLTYASAKVSKDKNVFEAAFTDLKSIFGSLPGVRSATVNAPLRSSKGLDLQKPAIDISGGRTVYAPASPEADAISQQASSPVVTLSGGGITEDDSHRIRGAMEPFHSSGNQPFVASRSDTSRLGFHGTTATGPSGVFIPSGSGSAPDSVVHLRPLAPRPKPTPYAKPVPEPSWIVLVGTAFAFSVLWMATRVIRTRLSRRWRPHS